jgi:predicted ATP-dependent Lon-type protease
VIRDEPVARPLPTHRTTQTQNKFIQISILRVGFEPMTAVFERAKKFHALDSAVTLVSILLLSLV